MRGSLFVDASFVVALINDRDQYHALAVEIAARHEGCQLVTTDAVLLEVANALACRFRSEAAKVIEGFFLADDVEIVPLSRSLFERAFKLYCRSRDKAWGLTDCASFVVMSERKITLALSSDHHFAQAGFEALLTEK